ncbi:MAG: class I SAM-dependent methyltransferase [Anaerolineae bacterium]|nr:class I SAM-dependent methyltransferase [Thermoflexales bacterium]MDW8408142.1 class I SAM-dependent methyltransferase [Anaerolineae bacterium]
MTMPDSTSAPAYLHVRREYDFLADFLNRYWFAPPVALWRAIEARTLATLDFPAPLLDFGCGDGLFTDAVFGKQAGIFGCDIAPAELPSARDSGVYRFGVQFADGHALPYRDGSFGSVYANSVIEHIPDPQHVLLELARVLRAGGQLVLTVPSDRFRSLLHGVKTAPDRQAAAAYAANVDRLLAHYHYHSADEWRVLLHTVGVRLVEARYYVSPNAADAWDRMNGEYGIGRRSWFSLIVSPRLRKLGYQHLVRRPLVKHLEPRLRPLYTETVRDEGAGMLIVGRKAE